MKGGTQGGNVLYSVEKKDSFQVRILCRMVKSFLRAILGTSDIIPVSLSFFYFFCWWLFPYSLCSVSTYVCKGLLY